MAGAFFISFFLTKFLSMPKKNILIFGNYGGQNWGDEMILSGILSAIPHAFFEVSVVSSDPHFTSRIHGVSAFFPPPFGLRSLFRRGNFSVFSVIQKADFVIFGGGGLLQDREKKAIFLWSFYVAVVRFFRKKILFVGNSIGPLSRPFSRVLAKNALSTTPFFSSRDQASLDFLKEIAKEKQSFGSTDCVFLLSKFPAQKKRKGTLIALRGDGHISVKKIKSIFSLLPKPIFAIAQDSVDENFAQEMGVEVLTPKNLREVKKAFSQAELVLTSRLHGGIFSLMAETPFVCFSAAPKIHSFFSERDLGEAIFPEAFSRKKLSSFLLKIQKDKEFFRVLRRIRQNEAKKAKNLLPIFLQKD